MEDTYIVDGVLFHHGIKGQKWGKRRYQNEDGSLTPSGKARYGYETVGNRRHTKAANAAQRDADNLRKSGYKTEADAVQKVADKHRQKAAASQEKYDQKQAAKAERKQFKADVKDFKRRGFDIDYTVENGQFNITKVRNSKGQEIGRDYAERVMKEARKQYLTEFAVSATVAAGAAFATSYLSRYS